VHADEDDETRTTRAALPASIRSVPLSKFEPVVFPPLVTRRHTMPSRPRTRERALQPVALDDLFEDVVEIDYGEADLAGSEAEAEAEEEEEEDGQASGSDGEEGDGQEQERLVDGGPPARARVSPVAAAGAAAERATTPTCPVCMDPWTSQGPHRIR
jgi:E3 ubiquitin-protein ligase RFWD3